MRIEHWFVLEYVDSGITRTACPKRREERARFYQRSAAGVDQHGGRLHARQVVRFNDVARRGGAPHVHRDDGARLEKFNLVTRGRISIQASPRERFLARPRHYIHAKCFTIAGNRRADAPITEDAQGLSSQCCADTDLPLTCLE